MDCTSSMEPWIQAAKEQIRNILQNFPHANFQVGFIGYRDHGDTQPLVVVPFTDVDTLLRSIDEIHAEGGDDLAEDVYIGMLELTQSEWAEADIRFIFHIADAPPHGIDFHSVWLSDNFPQTPKEPLLNVLTQLSNQGIHYTFVRINNSTDTMLELFRSAYTGPGTFKVIDLINQEPPRSRRVRRDDPTMLLTPTITMSIRESITQHTSSQDPTNL
jgi:hypothetical protein